MILNTLSFSVQASQKHVFNLLSNPENIPMWNSQTDSSQIISKEPLGEGTVFVAGMKNSQSRYHVTKYAPNNLVKFEEQGGVRFIGTLKIKKINQHKTHISYLQEVEKRLLFSMLKPLIRRSIRRYNLKDEQLIRALVEK